MRRRLARYALLGGIFLGCTTLLSFDNPSDRYFDIAKNMEILSSVYAEVNRSYVDEIDPNQFMKTGIDAMLESLDPYTTYIPEDDIEDFRFISTGQYGGIGSVIGNRDGRILILMPYEGFPAYKAGLVIGDEIIEIDGTNVEGKSTSDISKLLKGQAGTAVDVLIKRHGEPNLMPIEITREKITVKSVPYYGMVTDDIGYFKLTSFTQEASDDVTEAIQALRGEGAKKFIFDLRGNTGGLLREAIDISNLFIPKNKEVVSTRGKVSKWNQTHYASKPPLAPDEPLVILVNGRSASASEIVSGVIQDYDRGVLIGTKTFGKGLVQATMSTAYNSQVKITTAKYYIPSGRCIQAIDYSNKDEDGEAHLIPDSLLVPHKTANGRTVYDGAGIFPDVEMKKEAYPEILSYLISENFIFDFGTEYKHKTEKIAEPKDFDLTDADFAEFTAWLDGKEFDYTTSTERLLERFQKQLKEDSAPEFDGEFAAMFEKVKAVKKDHLQTHRKEIMEELEEEIVSRYFLQRGVIESSFDNDEDVLEAVNVLNDKQRYKEILAVE